MNSKWTKEKCIEVAKTCESRDEFRKKFAYCKTICKNNGWIDIFYLYLNYAVYWGLYTICW